MRVFGTRVIVFLAIIALIAGTSGCSLVVTTDDATWRDTIPTLEPVASVPTSAPVQAAAARPTVGQGAPAAIPPAIQAPAAPSAPANLSRIEAVARVRPAVVNITSQVIAYDMFMRAVPDEGVGSGVIFDAKGLILTNNHVVEGARSLRVTLPDGRSFDASIVGTDDRSDLAVISIEGDSLPVAALGDSDQLQIAEEVIAIGNALALPGGPTVTVGVVGAIGRHIETEDGNVLYDLIQTDAAINPGNSGGPLINLAGQVVGINTALAEAPGGGIGFAIAINSARPIVAELMAHGKVARPWFGIEFDDVTPQMVATYGLGTPKGVLITRVIRNSPAFNGGLRPGDVVVSVDDVTIDDSIAMLKAISTRAIGAKVTITYYRGDQVRTAEIIPMEAPN